MESTHRVVLVIVLLLVLVPFEHDYEHDYEHEQEHEVGRFLKGNDNSGRQGRLPLRWHESRLA